MNAIATVPAPNDPDVLQLLAINNLRGPAELLPYKDMGYDSQWCHISAKHCALNSGGRRVHGWALWRWDVPQATPPQTILFAEHHSVWEPPNGALVDVTPRRFGVPSVLFVRDDSAVITLKDGSFLMRTDLTSWPEITRVITGNPTEYEFYPLKVEERPDLLAYCRRLDFDPCEMATDREHG